MTNCGKHNTDSGRRSIAQPLFITRRLQDLAEASGDKLFLVFLDWEKAFDKVDQEKLIEAMQRLGTPEKAIRILKSFCVNPRFRVKDIEGKSSYTKTKSRDQTRLSTISILVRMSHVCDVP